VIQVSSLPPTVSGGVPPEATAVAALAAGAPAAQAGSEPGRGASLLPGEGLVLEEYLDGVKHQYMLEALARSGGVQTRAAELLGMSFRSFRYYAKKFRVGEEGDA